MAAERDGGVVRHVVGRDFAEDRDARRIATKPGKAAKARRVDAKKARSSVKQGRGKIQMD